MNKMVKSVVFVSLLLSINAAASSPGLLWTAEDGVRLNEEVLEALEVDNGYWYAFNHIDGSYNITHGKLASDIKDGYCADTEADDGCGWLQVSDKTAITNDGFQVLFTTKNGFWNSPAYSGIGFNWSNEKFIDIKELGGLCLIYNLDGESMEIQINMDDSEDGKFPWATHDRYIAVLEPGNHSINISWVDFTKEYGITTLRDAVENSRGIQIQLRNKSIEIKQSLLTLREIGAYGSCSGEIPPDAIYTGELAKGLLPKGGLMWNFANILENPWADIRVQTPEVQNAEPDNYTTGGHWYEITWVSEANEQLGNIPKVFQSKGESFQLKDDTGSVVEGGAIDNEHGLQVRLTTEKELGEWDNVSAAGIAFSWNYSEWNGEKNITEVQNITAFDGLCLVYNLSGDAMKLQLGIDFNDKYHHSIYGPHSFILQPGNHSINIPWNAFVLEYGLTKLENSLEEATQIRFILHSSKAKSNEALFTIREFGSYGSCSPNAPEPAVYAGEGLVPPPSEDEVLWDFASGNQDVRIIVDEGDGYKKSNDNGWLWGYAFDHGGDIGISGWVSNDGEYFNQNFTENGLQVGLIANATDDVTHPGGAGIGFIWNNEKDGYDDTIDINNFGGVCLVYAMEGSAPNLDVELTVDIKKNDFSTSTFFAQVPNTNGKKAIANIPWSSFYKTWGATTKTTTLNASRGINFRINNDTNQEQDAQVTLLQLGKLGACRLSSEEYVEFLSPKSEAEQNLQILVKPIIADKSAEDAKPTASNLTLGNLQLSAVSNGLSIVANSNAKLTIFNLKGGVAMQKNLGAGEQFVSLKNLNSGIYIAQLKQGSQVRTIKISK